MNLLLTLLPLMLFAVLAVFFTKDLMLDP